ncbi:MAG: two-component regulator, partial [Thermoleophilia bacterium]|nr:two-component regulator [Thermoleophilia bacterium]
MPHVTRAIVGRRATDLHSVAETAARSTVLVVDDQPNNLQVVELILEPLDVNVITAGSGEEALRILLEHDIAVIVLDVRMPGMDGFETAAYVKRRERTRHVPIIFLTAVGNDREQALSGYQAGAVDFIEKPIEPLVLCAKVATFAELHASRLEVARQAELLREAARREAEVELQEAREAGEQRYRDLAEAIPSMVFAMDADGVVTYRSGRWDDFTGPGGAASFGDIGGTWELVHPTDRAGLQSRWAEALSAPDALADGHLELHARLRRWDGVWLWHDIICRPRRSAEGEVVGWVGTATEVDHQRRTDLAQRTLADAGAELVAATDWVRAMLRVAELTVPAMADWCSIDVVELDGGVRRIALRVDGDLDPTEVERLGELLAPGGEHSPTERLLGIDPPARIALDEHGRDTDDDGRLSALAIPLTVRGRRVGVLGLAAASRGRTIGVPEHSFARSLASRLAAAVDNARLYRSAEERAQAAEVLDAIADGVALVDGDGVVRLWNPAAATITGV